MGHEKLFENMCQRTFFSKSGASKLKETIKIQYYTLSIQKMYWELKKTQQKDKLVHFQGDKGHGATSDVVIQES
jgi:hypothetical protein